MRSGTGQVHESFRRDEQIEGSSDRAFGIVFTVAFAVIGSLPLLWGNDPRLWAYVVAGSFFAVAVVRPGLLAPLNRMWTRLSVLLGKVVTPVVLGVLFFAIITPVATVTRLFGRDALRRRLEPLSATYWLDREPIDPETVRRQF
jgi:Saxitoxin biosynthesis operon protein SxtJ